MKILNFALKIYLFLSASVGESLELRHIIGPSDTFESLQTQGLCHSILESYSLPRCLPWSSYVENSGSISVSALAKANENGIYISKRIRDQDINPQFLDEIFRDNSFQDISGLIQAKATYRQYSISIIPIHFAAGFKLSNPSLPEVHFIQQRQSLIQIGATWQLGIKAIEAYGEFIVAPVLYRYNRDTKTGDFDVLDAATTSTRDLIDSRRYSGYNADLAMGWSSKIWYSPSLMFQGYRLFAEPACSSCQKSYLELESQRESLSQVALTWAIDHSIGQSVFGAVGKFYGRAENYLADKSALAYVYKISRLKSFLSYSQQQSSFGFLFDAGLYRLGIQYSNEAHPVALQAKRLNQSYVFTSLVF